MNELKAPVRQPHPIEDIRLVPSGGGVFDVVADGELIFSKKTLGRHAEPGEILRLVREKLG